MTKWKRLLTAISYTIRQLAVLALGVVMGALFISLMFSSLTAFCLLLIIITLVVWVRQNYMACVREEAREEYMERQRATRKMVVDACTRKGVPAPPEPPPTSRFTGGR